MFIPGVGQLIQGRVLAWLAFSTAWVIGLVLCFFCIGFFIVPIVMLVAVVEAAVYDENNPNPLLPALAMLAALAVSLGGAILLMLGVLGLGAAAVSSGPESVPAATAPADEQAAPPSVLDEPIVLDERPESEPPSPAPGESPAPVGVQPAEPATSDPAETPPPEERNEREYHTWTSGKFSTEAQFVSMTAGVVKLKKRDGSVIEVPLEKLSEGDQEYIRTRAYKRGE